LPAISNFFVYKLLEFAHVCRVRADSNFLEGDITMAKAVKKAVKKTAARKKPVAKKAAKKTVKKAVKKMAKKKAA
jgi:hypothetical protein